LLQALDDHVGLDIKRHRLIYELIDAFVDPPKSLRLGVHLPAFGNKEPFAGLSF